MQSRLKELLEISNVLSDEKITAIYLQIYRDDVKEGKSNSIANQRKVLMDFRFLYLNY